MAKNVIFDDADNLALAVSHPATPVSGQPVRCGTSLTGLALTDEQPDGLTTVAVGSFVAELSARGVDGGGNSAIALYDKLYYTDADTPPINKKNTGVLWGIALGTVGSGATATIRVLHVPQS